MSSSDYNFSLKIYFLRLLNTLTQTIFLSSLPKRSEKNYRQLQRKLTISEQEMHCLQYGRKDTTGKKIINFEPDSEKL
jgi:hypothetical protein